MAHTTRLPRLPLRPITQGVLRPRNPTHYLFHSVPYTYTNRHGQVARHQSTSSSSSMPRIAQSSVWTSMIPSFIRGRSSSKSRDARKSEEWNPATFYIIIFILIGSQAIRMLLLRNEWMSYTRSTDAKIGLLREIIEKVKRGEKVDVEKILGTGDMGKEREWEEVLREIETEDSLWHQKTRRDAEEAAAQAEQRKLEASAPKEPVIPAESDSDQAPPRDAQSRRKLNFF